MLGGKSSKALSRNELNDLLAALPSDQKRFLRRLETKWAGRNCRLFSKALR